MTDLEAYWEKEGDISIPERAVQFPTTWGDDHPDPSIPGACVVKMTWRKGRFQVTYADGDTYTQTMEQPRVRTVLLRYHLIGYATAKGLQCLERERGRSRVWSIGLRYAKAPNYPFPIYVGESSGD